MSMAFEKIPKPVVNAGSASGKEDPTKIENKEFHYVYILKKLEVAPPAEAVPAQKVEEKKIPAPVQKAEEKKAP